VNNSAAGQINLLDFDTAPAQTVATKQQDFFASPSKDDGFADFNQAPEKAQNSQQVGSNNSLTQQTINIQNLYQMY
jgi:hypothetical protein